MARPERIPLEVPSEVGTGRTINVFRFRDKTVQLAGPFVGSLQLEGSIDGDTFTPLSAPLVAPGFVLVPQTVALLRVRVTEFTSGAPTAAFAGFDFRAL